ncbi:MAG: 4Fe-4S binding protein [Thermoanaerobaculia bacterium]|nr:4Fe-4S binding protein [Thermoanaerobaculia bacterium]
MALPVFPRWNGRHSRRRRLIQIGFLAVFALLPLFDLFRFDLPAGRLHLFGAEIWLDEWTYLWLAGMFALWIVGALSLIFGRVYCAYACPQMVFSELAHDVDALAKRVFRGRDPKFVKKASRVLSLAIIAVLSITASVLFMGYFAPLGDVVRRLFSFDVGLWLGAVGAATTLVAFLDIAFVREGFCRSACPYGLLQGLLEDGKSLHVNFSEASGPCIDCQLCVRRCPMDIDIRQGAFQIECTRCGTCIDACDEILIKKNRPGLLAFDFSGFSVAGWDLKRTLVAVSTVGFGVVLAIAVARRDVLSLQLAPLPAEATTTAAGVDETRFLLRAANRGSEPVALSVETEGLPADAEVQGAPTEPVPAGQEQRWTLLVRLPAEPGRGGLQSFTWVVDSRHGAERFPGALLAHDPAKQRAALATAPALQEGP